VPFITGLITLCFQDLAVMGWLALGRKSQISVEARQFIGLGGTSGGNSSTDKQLQSLNNRLSYDFRATPCA
jgi:hypothetical protein